MQCKSVSVFPLLHRYSLFSCLIAILVGCSDLIRVWFGFAFPQWVFFHVLVNSLSIFFGKMSIQVFCPFLNWGAFLYLRSKSSYILDLKALSDVRFANTFSLSVGYLLTSSIVSCGAHKVFSFDEVQHICFLCLVVLLVSYLSNNCQIHDY